MNTTTNPTRRDVLRGGAIAGAAALAAYSIPAAVHAQASQELKIGLLGVGGRGGGAALQALGADPNSKLVTIGEAFPDRLQSGLKALMKSPHADRVDVPPERQFVGFDAYKGVMANCDVVLLCTPPHFRPQHLAAAVEAGKHIFCEKPVATDGPGLRSVLESSRKAKEKNLSLVSGLCYRYDAPKIETIGKIHDGAVGEIIALQTTYNTGGLWNNPRQPNWSDMEWQMRNWLYFTWLSGDLITEQHIHSLDKILWTMHNELPEKVTATGGRIVRTQPEYGNIYDHFNCVFEWKSGVRCFASARQWAGSGIAMDVSDWVFGSEGKANIQNHQIWGKNAWKRKEPAMNMYDAEHVALFKSIRDGKPINNGDYMVKATQMAIMGRMSAYTGTIITADQVMNSQENLAPEKYEFGPLPTPPIAVPGKMKYA